MKIAFFVTTFPALPETFILNQITGLIDRGYEVDIYSRKRIQNNVIHTDVEKYNLQPRTIYYSEGAPTIPKNILKRYWKALLILFKNRSSVKILLRSLRFTKYGKKAYTLAHFYQIAAFLNKNLESYDVFHCHFGPNGNIAALLKDVGLINGRIVTVFHAYELTRLIRNRGEHIFDDLFRIGDLFMPISYKWKLRLEELGCPREKIVVHRMGVDTNTFQFRDRAAFTKTTIKILTVARLVEKKGVEYAIRAFAGSFNNKNDVEYLIAGNGPLRDELEKLTESLGIADNVSFLGWKNQDEIADLMNNVHIFILPSVTGKDGNQEGLPVVLMEAMARGIPVISTYHSGIPELVEDGVSGFLVPERDVEALSVKMKQLVENQKLWSSFGSEGRKKIEQEFDINLLNNKLIQHFKNITGQPAVQD